MDVAPVTSLILSVENKSISIAEDGRGEREIEQLVSFFSRRLVHWSLMIYCRFVHTVCTVGGQMHV